ncbi:histidine kinase, partial [Streptomyces sp. HSW2009]|uniref:sensor histidine kinase n=1 Tax=Streptomyces sp. HSW2009 TaxID=3142890 RepID=UPI0032ED79F0
MSEFTAALRGVRHPPTVAAPTRPTGLDVALAVVVLAVQTALAISVTNDGSRPDLFGWILLVVSALALVSRRTAPTVTTVVVVLAVGPYHSLDYAHLATVPAGIVALYALAVGAPARRSLWALAIIVAVMAVVMSNSPDHQALGEMLRSSGWLLAVVVIGIALRTHRNYVAAIVERAERAERTREEEAARRVAEERLRIARDLHDLLAHSITLIGVQTSVAAHVLVADPDRLDRDAVSKALDSIADTCRAARAELRTTLQVLRAGEAEPAPDATRPPPGLAGLPDLARSAEMAGARVTLELDLAPDTAAEIAPAVGAAAYRIVQEALTNAVRHAGPDVRTVATVRRVSLPWAEGEALNVTVCDDGPVLAAGPARPAAGRRERPADPMGGGEEFGHAVACWPTEPGGVPARGGRAVDGRDRTAGGDGRPGASAASVEHYCTGAPQEADGGAAWQSVGAGVWGRGAPAPGLDGRSAGGAPPRARARAPPPAPGAPGGGPPPGAPPGAPRPPSSRSRAVWPSLMP